MFSHIYEAKGNANTHKKINQVSKQAHKKTNYIREQEEPVKWVTSHACG
jgi:hypothetical protein